MSIPLVNASIFLHEEDPSCTDYNDTGSCYQRLIQKNIYQSINILYICFVTITPTADGSSYTIEIESASHRNGFTNQDYMNYVIRDARANNPNIKIVVTLDWNDGNLIYNIFSNSAYTPEQNAQKFATNLIAYLQKYDLDGFDLDWEYPIANQTTQEQFKLLISAIGSQFKQQKHYYLTLSPAVVDNLDADTVNKYVDFINIQLSNGYTTPSQFTDTKIDSNLLAYGSNFEKIGVVYKPDEKGYQNADEAYQDNQNNYHYVIFTSWRLDADNYVFAQDQQQRLSQLVFLPQWVGTYQTTYGSSGTSPILKIQPDQSGNISIFLDNSLIKDWIFTGGNCQLSWQKTKDNLSAATLTFTFNPRGQRSFTGTLEVDSKATFSGVTKQSLAQWKGTYQTTYSNSDNKPIWGTPPDLKIQEDESEDFQVFLTGSLIKGWNYNPSNCQLSWQKTNDNWSTATLTFDSHQTGQKTFKGDLKVGGNGTKISEKTGIFSGTKPPLLTQWVGTYQTTYSTTPPVLKIQEDDSGDFQVFLDNNLIKDWTYTPSDGQLSWQKTDSNSSSANLTFTFNQNGERNFTGTLETDTFSGKVKQELPDQWVGTYSKTTYYDFNSKPIWATPPVLKIQKDGSGCFQVFLNESLINGWNYTPVNFQLSWQKTNDNWSAATLTFATNSSVQKSFTGNLEVGGGDTSLDYKNGTFSGQEESLSKWLGGYQTSYSPWSIPPNLAIQQDKSGNLQVFLSSSLINNWTYTPSNCQLSWQKTDGNWSAATLTFTTNSSGQKSFTGNLDVGGSGTSINQASGAFSGYVS